MKLKLFLLIVLAAVCSGASAQLKIGDQPTNLQKAVALDVKGSNGKQGLWLPRVNDTTNAGIDGLNPPDGLLIYYIPSQNLMVRLNGSWVPIIKYDTSINKILVEGNTAITGTDITLKTGTSAGTTNDFNLVGIPGQKEITINLPNASATVRGAVTIAPQTFGGLKTFGSGAIVNNGLNVAGSLTNRSNLTLGITSATSPGTSSDRFLTVDPLGKVTLNTLAAITNVTAGGTPMTGPALTYNTANSGTDFTISSSGNTATWNLPDASLTARGAVNTAAQTFGGLKNFATGATVSGATGSTSNLTLGLTSATAALAQTTKYLSVDATGKVTLNSLNSINTVTAGGNTLLGPDLVYNTSATGSDFTISSIGNTATWNLPDASAVARGAVTNLAQTFGGLKTFATGATVSGATGSASNLTLGLTSATAAAAQTTKYLSVDAAGKVTLNNLNALTSVNAGGNSLTGPALTYNTANSGADFTITTLGNTATWNLPDASTTARGAVNYAAQTFGGLKTFANGVVVNNGSILNGGTTANGGLSVSGNTASTSNLTLGITSATTPASQTTKYLSVDPAGKVTLNALNVISSVTAGASTMTGPALTYVAANSGNDFTITSSGNTASWNLPDAATTARGVVNTTAQTFGGLKTFANGVTVNNGASVTGATGSTSNLTLGITSNTTTTGVGSDVLSVDANGKVFLTTTNVEANKPSRILNYTLTIFGANIAPNSTYQVVAALPAAANVSFPASVYISPTTALTNGTTIDYATILNDNLVANISTRGNSQNLTNYIFYVTIVDF